jgi:hypothetical protein
MIVEHLVWAGFELTTLVVIVTDCIGSYKSNYNTITTMNWIVFKKLPQRYYNLNIVDSGVKHHKPSQPLEDENETDKFDFFSIKNKFHKNSYQRTTMNSLWSKHQ